MSFQRIQNKTLITTTEEGLVVDTSEKEVTLFYAVKSVKIVGETCEVELHFSASEDGDYRFYNSYNIPCSYPVTEDILSYAEQEVLKLEEFSKAI